MTTIENETLSSDEIIMNPGPRDILSGRGSGTTKHHGNQEYLRLINKYKALAKIMSRTDKQELVKELYGQFRSMDFRFLKQIKTEGGFAYTELPPKKAQDKIRQALNSKERGMSSYATAPQIVNRGPRLLLTNLPTTANPSLQTSPPPPYQTVWPEVDEITPAGDALVLSPSSYVAFPPYLTQQPRSCFCEHCGCLKPTGIISEPHEISKLFDNETVSSLGQSPFQLDTLGLEETDLQLTPDFDDDDLSVKKFHDLMDELFTADDLQFFAEMELLSKDSEEGFGGMEHVAAAASQQLLNVAEDPKDNEELPSSVEL